MYRIALNPNRPATATGLCRNANTTDRRQRNNIGHRHIGAYRRETGATLRVAGDAEVTLFPILGVSLSDVAVALPRA